MKILKNKLLYLAPIVAIIVIGLLATAFYPAYNPKPKALPIAIVNLDEGIKIQDKTQNIGKTFIDKVTDNKDLNKTVKFIKVSSEKDLQKGFDHNNYYGSLVIPKDFSKSATSAMRSEIQSAKMKEAKQKASQAQKELQQKIQSGVITPAQAQVIIQEMKTKQKAMQEKNKELMKPIKVEQANVYIKVNQGASMQAANISDTILTKMTSTLNEMLAKNNIMQLSAQNISIPANKVNTIAHPVKIDKMIMNKIKDHQAMGSAPMLLFTPVWLGSLITSVLLYFAFRQANIIGKKERLIGSLMQILVASMTAISSGFIATYYITHVLDLDVSSPLQVSIYISIAMFGFIMLILGLMSMLGMKAIPLFMLALFFSMQLLVLPKQMLPQFYQDYIIGWNPFRHYADGLRELIYLNHDLTFNTSMQMYLGLAICGVILIIIASQVKAHVGKRSSIPS